MVITRAALGGILLFLGRELNFIFAAGMAALIGFRVAPLLPAAWPAWSYYAFIGGLALIGAAVPLINERAGYILSGILSGGYFAALYFAPNIPNILTLPFIFGALLGGIIMGVLTEWALMVVSSLVGAFYVMDLFAVTGPLRTMISGGLFLAGALTQVVLRRMQKNAE